MPTFTEICSALSDQLGRAEMQGLKFLEISAGELARVACNSPDGEHRLAWCVTIMRAAVGQRDKEIRGARRQDASTFTIRYALPRN